MRIKNLTAGLITFDLPTRSLHLPGRSKAEVSAEELLAPQIIKAKEMKIIRELQDKKQAVEPMPVAPPTPSVADVEPNDSSDDNE